MVLQICASQRLVDVGTFARFGGKCETWLLALFSPEGPVGTSQSNCGKSFPLQCLETAVYTEGLMPLSRVELAVYGASDQLDRPKHSKIVVA